MSSAAEKPAASKFEEPLKDQARQSRLRFKKEFERRCEDEARRQTRNDACGGAVTDFVKCAHGRTVTAAYYCRYYQEKMNECLKLNNTPAFREQVRAEMLAAQGPHARNAVQTPQ